VAVEGDAYATRAGSAARVNEPERRVTALELLFDLVFVFAIIQVTGLMSADPTWGGLGRGLLVLAALWWAWTGYAWLTNALEHEAVAVRLAIFGAMGAMLLVALAVPRAFAADSPLFGLAYLIVRAVQLALYDIGAPGDRDLRGQLLGFVPFAVLGPALLAAAGFLDGPARPALWAVALALDYAGGLITRGRGALPSPAHFAERHGRIVLIALGESIIYLGVGAAGLPLGAGLIAAVLLGAAVIATLWWAYFDHLVIAARRALAEARGAAGVRLARDCYSYLHLPMVAAIVLFALGLEKALQHVDAPLDPVAAGALCGGLSLYFLAHVGFRLRLSRQIGRGRAVAAAVLLALTPAALNVPALAALALVTAACGGLIVCEVVRYREGRTRVRQAR
jgi:low temperature requirement protein LtrA